MNHNTKEQNEDEDPDNDEDLRRFLRGGFGAKYTQGYGPARKLIL